MTTQLPYPQQPPTPAYPTTPPWATPPAEAPVEPAPHEHDGVSPWDAPYTEHGGLLVPYPEEMRNASRAEPPPWWPVIAWTFFFGVLGVVSAARRAAQARRGRNSPAPYWVAWVATMAVSAVAGAVIVAAGVPAYLAYREDQATRAVQQQIMTDGRLESSAHVTATAAKCVPAGVRDAAGIRRYDCVVTLSDGRSGSMAVTAARDGVWTAVS